MGWGSKVGGRGVMGLGGCAVWNGPSAVAPFLSRRNKTKELRPLSPHRGLQGGAGGTLCRGAGQEPPPNPWGCRGSLPHSALGWMLQERCSAPCHPMAAALGGSQRGGGLGNGAGLLGSAGRHPPPPSQTLNSFRS